VVGIGLAMLMGGVVVTEKCLLDPGAWPIDGGRRAGAGLSGHSRAWCSVFSVVYVLINLLVDLSYPFFDPRIRV
jgi:peptide/nickel transport system permease protein